MRSLLTLLFMILRGGALRVGGVVGVIVFLLGIYAVTR
jgi:hypothetical protein